MQIGINDLKVFTPDTPAVAPDVSTNFDVIKTAHNDTDARVGTLETDSTKYLDKTVSNVFPLVQKYKSTSITGATNATPIVITSVTHGKSNGDSVYIDDIVGNTAPNGKGWVVANKTPDTFELVGSVGNGTYTSGGTVYSLPKNKEELASVACVNNAIFNNKGIAILGSCTTASATAEKAVTLSGFTYIDGASTFITMTNANTANVPTFNFNSLGAMALYSEDGVAVSASNPAFFPAGCRVELVYSSALNGFIYKNKIITSYVNGTSWYEIYTSGKIRQGGYSSAVATLTDSITFLKSFKDTNYSPRTTNANGVEDYCWTSVVSRSTTGMVIAHRANAYWEASGY